MSHHLHTLHPLPRSNSYAEEQVRIRVPGGVAPHGVHRVGETTGTERPALLEPFWHARARVCAAAARSVDGVSLLRSRSARRDEPRDRDRSPRGRSPRGRSPRGRDDRGRSPRGRDDRGDGRSRDNAGGGQFRGPAPRAPAPPPPGGRGGMQADARGYDRDSGRGAPQGGYRGAPMDGRGPPGRNGPLTMGGRPGRIETPSNPPVDREKQCPMLIRIFCKIGQHHQDGDFSYDEQPIEDEVLLHTWRDATFAELTELLAQVHREIRHSGTRCAFKVVFPGGDGKWISRQLGSTAVGRGLQDDISMQTLASMRFQAGDFMSVAIHPTRKGGEDRRKGSDRVEDDEKRKGDEKDTTDSKIDDAKSDA